MADKIFKLIDKDIDEMIDKYDSSGDDVITRKEALSYFKKNGSEYPEKSTAVLFEIFDKDKDGKITVDEIIANSVIKHKDLINNSVEVDVQAFLMKHDGNKDQKIDYDELVENLKLIGSDNPKRHADLLFEDIDTNKDRVLSIDEIRNFAKKSYTFAPEQ